MDETRGKVDHLLRLGTAHSSLWIDAIIGNFFSLVSSREESSEMPVNVRILFCQPGKGGAQSAMALRDPGGAFEEKGLRGMEPGEISRACSLVAIMHHVEQVMGFAQVFARPWRGARMFPVSQIEPIPPQFVHEAGAIPVRAGRKVS